ncbi:hypothetical protein [Chitinophaga japonensis]|nr:hypothetical protein [Chitinophaga japonensis]
MKQIFTLRTLFRGCLYAGFANMFLLMALPGYAQSDSSEPAAPVTQTSDNTNDIVPVEFDLGARSLKHILPFDKQFSIKFTNIPAGVQAIIARVYVINDASYERKHYRNGPKEIDFKYVMSLPDNRVLKSDSLVRNAGFSGTEASTLFPFKLKPNHNYILEVEANESAPLTASQQEALAATLKEDASLTRFIDTIAYQRFVNPTGYKMLPAVTEGFSSAVATAVKKADPSYILVKKDYETELKNIVELFRGIGNASRNLADLERRLLGGNNATLSARQRQQQVNINAVRRNVRNIKWIALQKNDDTYTKLVGQLGKIARENDSTALNEALADDTSEFIRELDEVIAAKDQAIDELISQYIVSNVRSNRVLSATYPQDFVKQARLYITFDLGLAYVGRMDRANVYTGLNIYFRPLDKTIPLSHYREPWDFVLSRTSLLLGFSITSVQQDSVRKGLLDDNKALVLGVGFRLTPWLKINSGGYFYYKLPANPLASTNNYRFAAAPFVSLSIDVDAKSLLQGIGDAVFKQ